MVTDTGVVEAMLGLSKERVTTTSAAGTESDNTTVRVTDVLFTGTVLLVAVLLGFPKLAEIVSTWRTVLVEVKLGAVARMLLFLSVLMPVTVANAVFWNSGMVT